MRKKPKPNFLIIGAAKAATTSLSSLLDGHPQAGIVRGKEPHFFSYDGYYQQGWKHYLKLYEHCDNKRAIGDASTSYSRIRYHPQTIERIKQHVPRAKIIYMVRHPLERMESAYVEHMCSPGTEVFSSINDAVHRQPMIIDSSRYWEVFDAYRRAFDESRMKVVWFEDYVADQKAVFQDVCRFLEIDEKASPNLKREHKNPKEGAQQRMAALGRDHLPLDTEWDHETREWIIDLLREDNCKFLDHFGKPRNHWGELF